jgi:hypothetical protein
MCGGDENEKIAAVAQPVIQQKVRLTTSKGKESARRRVTHVHRRRRPLVD